MKEEGINRKLPPKMINGASSGTTPTKMPPNDEILSTLLRINNFDSISSIKDESLDIDLSACVTISSDSMGMMNGNSLSSTDFWRVLDESAQNPQLDLTTGADDGIVVPVDLMSDAGAAQESNDSEKSATSVDPTSSGRSKITLERNVKREITSQTNNFSGTFLRPEPPSAPLFSPFKKVTKTSPTPEQHQQLVQRKLRVPFVSSLLDSKKLKVTTYAIKEEPPEQLLADPMEDVQPVKKAPISSSALNVIINNKKTISTSATTTAATTLSSFNLFMSNNNSNNSVTTSTTETATSHRSVQQQHQLHQKQQQEQEQQHKTQEGNEESAPSSPSQQPLYKCLDCNLILFSQQEFSTHESASHRILYKCGVCERDFEQEAGLKKHLKTHRSMDARKDAWKKCPDCGKCLKLGSMWMHRKIHSDNKKYGCDICGQKFVQKINLTHHSRVHTAEKPYECPECQKRFQERSHLQRHQKYHAQTRSYRCDKCGKMYKTERCLKVHNLVHLEQRPFACNVCEKSFISNSKLKQHSNIHTGERPFKCNYCPRDFTNFPNWLKHTRRRHKVDHKTGEHLENIPSYCSKKSTKTAKAGQQQKTAETTKNGTMSSTNEKVITSNTTSHANNLLTTTTTITTATAPKVINVTQAPNLPASLHTSAATTTPATTNKTQVKRKKKINPIMVEIPAALVTGEQPISATLPPQAANIIVNLPTTAAAASRTSLLTTTKMNTNKTPVVVTATPIGNKHQTNVNSLNSNMVTIAVNTSAVNKAIKVKRERKQLTPKQLQKPLLAPPPTPPPLQLITIKREQPDEKISVNSCSSSSTNKATLHLSTANQFADMHCLSMTSAEDFIMEQALEMEESGLYIAPTPATNVDTDNAISSESAAAIHFKIKNEFGVLNEEEEFVTLKEANSRVLCSSLESSPFSSPASIELPPIVNSSSSSSLTIPNGIHMPVEFSVAGTNSTMSTTNSITAPTTTTTFFLPPFAALSAHGTIITSLSSAASMTNTKTTIANTNSSTLNSATLLHQMIAAQAATSAAAAEEPPTAHLNSIYFPMSVGMPLLVQSNQVLPSVDTLFSSSAAANAKFFRSKSVTTQQTTAARHNLT